MGDALAVCLMEMRNFKSEDFATLSHSRSHGLRGVQQTLWSRDAACRATRQTAAKVAEAWNAVVQLVGQAYRFRESLSWILLRAKPCPGSLAAPLARVEVQTSLEQLRPTLPAFAMRRGK